MKHELGLIVTLIVSLVLTAVAPLEAGAPPLEPLQQLAQVGARVSYHALTGQVRFIGADVRRPIPRVGAAAADPEQAARAFLDAYGGLFGLTDQASELTAMRIKTADRGRSFARFQQVYQGVPVLGGELIVHMDQDKNVISANGELLPQPQVNIVPTISAEEARRRALEALAKYYGTDALVATQPELWLYNPILLGGPGPRLTRLVWRMEVRSTMLQPIRELALVDAHLGGMALHFNQIDAARNRAVYDNQNDWTKGLPGNVLVCTEGNCPGSGNDYNYAYNYSGDTYNFYATYHGRDSLDNAGLPLISTVRFCPDSANCPYENAFWNGQQMVYGAGYASADDVVGHEMTHGVTDYESRLFYYMQSGAINEAFSDIWGELIDLTNSAGNDSSAVRWLMGEDLPGGAIRNMSDPTASNQPDMMTSNRYYCGEQDNGGVHTNSGVANKAAYLMVDGGTFKGKTITALGITKTIKIWYEVQTNLFTSASDYQDLYDGLQQACANLVGTAGITAADCAEVKDAVDATAMNSQPTNCPAPHAPLCPTGQSPINLFYDDFEGGINNWVSGASVGSDEWYYSGDPNPYDFDPTYATSGSHNLWGYDQGARADNYVRMTVDVPLPAGSTPYLHFNHAYAFEDYGTTTYDGGVVEYSATGGSSWQDARLLFSDNGYNGTIATGYSNPLSGRQAFVSESNGYISSRANLSSLAGQSVRFRWRIGSDYNGDALGWFLDDVRIYTCETLVTRPNVGITKQIIGSNFKPGDYITFTLTINNSGNKPAASVIVTDIVPSQLLTPGYASTLTLTPIGSTPYVWNVGSLSAGASGVITLYGRINPALPGTFSFNNTAKIYDPQDATPDNNTSTVTVSGNVTYKIYLPIVIRRYPAYPDAPVLNAIANSDGDGNYTVSWNAAYLASTYELQEDDNTAFSSPAVVYSGANTTWSVAGHTYGTFYYRVKARNTFGDSAWSNIQSVNVNRFPNDTYYSQQWGLPKVNAPGAWRQSNGAGVTIAVIDTGVDLNHPDLAGKLVAGWDFANNDSTPQDDHGHGTHVAGIAAAVTNNSRGVAGLGWDAKIMPVKVLDSQGSGYYSWIASGIYWAVNNGAKVINLSLGGQSYASALQEATDYAYSQGALVVAASGNCGDPLTYKNNGCTVFNPVIYPGANPNVLGVGSTTSTDARSSFSSYGYWVDVAAPGSNIYSTVWNDTYTSLSGTSMASPLVAGLASLVWARNPALSNVQVAGVIMSTAVDLGTPGRDDYFGYGRVNAEAAVSAAMTAQFTLVEEAARPLANNAPLADASVRPGVVMLRFKPGVLATAQSAVLARHNLRITGQIEGLGILEVSVPEGQEREFAVQLAAEPAVEFAEPDYLVTVEGGR